MCDDNNVRPKYRYSHYNFLQEVGTYWLNPEIGEAIDESSTNPLSSPTGSAVSLLTTDSVSSQSSKRRKYFTDETLDARGLYQRRLFDHSLHFPVACKKLTGNVSKTTGKPIESKTKCDLHYWLGSQYRAQVMKCETCNVNLCIDCYRLFHVEPKLVERRDELKRKYNIP